MKSNTLTTDLKEDEQGPLESRQMQSVLAIGPTVNEIRQRAHELHLEHGCAHERDQDDWLEAERDLMEEHLAR